MRLASPRLANTKRRVTGPGIPSVYPSALLATVTSPSGAFSLSSVCSVPAEPPTNYGTQKNEKNILKFACNLAFSCDINSNIFYNYGDNYMRQYFARKISL